MYPPGRLESEPVPTTFPPPPQGLIQLVASSPAWGQPYWVSAGAFTVQLTWTCDPEVVGYNIMRGPPNGGGWAFVTAGVDQKPVLVRGCEYIDGVNGTEGQEVGYSVIGVYNDRASAERSVTVRLKP